MVTKSQKIHISKDDGLPNFTIATLLKIGSRFPRVAGILVSLKKILNLSSNTSYSLTGVHSTNKQSQERIVSDEGFFNIHFNCTGILNNNITNIY